MAKASSRSAAAKKAWATRRKLYGKSGRSSSKKSTKSMSHVERRANESKKAASRKRYKRKSKSSHTLEKDYKPWMDDPKSVAAVHKSYLRSTKRKSKAAYMTKGNAGVRTRRMH